MKFLLSLYPLNHINFFHQKLYSDLIVVLLFESLDFQKVKQLLNQNIIFDGRNLYDLEDIKKEGISYVSIGR